MTQPEFSRRDAFEFASQGDWARAVPAARSALSADPQDAEAQALLALGLAHLDEVGQALDAARRAVALDPELAAAHYALGWALLQHGQAEDAEAAAQEVLRLDPDADGYALLAAIHARKRRWQAVLDATASSLQIDPEHASSANLRALALASLGRTDEAEGTATEVLAIDPDNAYAHENRAWILLRQGRHREALEGFSHALRIDPSLDSARAGIVEALKARHGVYRPILKYFFWMSTLSDRARWFVIIGLFVGGRITRTLLNQNPGWWPVLGPLMAAYILFAYSTWLAQPLSNLLLRLNPFGRLALSKSETLASNVVGACLLLAAVAGIAYVAGRQETWGVLAIVSGVMLIPISGAFAAHETPAWRPLSNYAIVLAVCGVAAVVITAWSGRDAAILPFAAVLLGSFVFGWVANALMMRHG